jgi:diguanylate cyclase (GGDEF)-like protein/PAS domain S-box-containing protein
VRRAPFAVAARLTVASLAVHLLIVLSGAVGGGTAALLSKAGPPIAAAWMAVACVLAARASRGRVRRGWHLFAIAGVAWAAGAVDASDLLHLRVLATVAAGVAVTQWLAPALTRPALLRVLVDGLVVAVSLLFLSWSNVVEPLAARTQPGLDRFVVLVPVVGDVAVVALVLVAGGRVRRGSRLPWALLASGLVLGAIGDGALAYLRLFDVFGGVPVSDWAWTAAAACIALAACAPSDDATPLAQDPRPPRPFAILLPYAPIAIAGAEVLSRMVERTLDPLSIVIAITPCALLFVRQVVAQFETLTLTRQLDGLVRDRTDALHRQEQRLRSLVQHASDVLTVVDADFVVRYQSAAAETVFGIEPGSLLGRPVSSLVHPDDQAVFDHRLRDAQPPPHQPAKVEVRMRRADGTWTATETAISNLLDDRGVQGLLLTTRDVSDRKRLEEQLRHEALHDPLTGLGNRVLFHDRLEHAVALASRNPRELAVLVLDLDGFKAVNDTLGHAAGDRLLVEVARRLVGAVRPGDTVARMGGDEFAILIERAEPGMAESVAARVLTRLRTPIDIEGRMMVPSGSLGVAVGNTDRNTADDLLRAADLAMYTAKTSGKGRYEVFEEGMQQAAVLRVELEADLRRALHEGELVLHFQPIVELPSGRVSGAEALLRWQHPTRGLLPPSDFIGVAEESDLINEVGRWVLHASAAHVKAWEERWGAGRFAVSVNVAARQLLAPWLVDEVRSLLAETGIAPSSLVLEITEGALMSDNRPIEATLDGLKDLGVQLAIDDFGTGWSSLSRLSAFPVDKLKIDRAFVREITGPDDDVPLIAAIVAMAHSLGLELVAEGVETLEQLACLHGLGVEEVQGFLLARPLPSDALEELLDSPVGLLDAPDEAAAAELQLPVGRDLGFMDVVASAATDAPDASSVRAMLAELQRASGFDSVYLTAIHWDRQAQEVKATANGPRLAIPAGMVVPWPGSPCERMVGGGARCTADLGEEFPRHAFARFGGVRGHLTVPVVGPDGPDGRVYGTLCGASADRLDTELGVGLVRLFELFAALVARNLFDAPAATAAGPAAPPARVLAPTV